MDDERSGATLLEPKAPQRLISNERACLGVAFSSKFSRPLCDCVILAVCGLRIVFLRYGCEAVSGVGCLTLACVFTLICLRCLLSGPVERVVTDDVNY